MVVNKTSEERIQAENSGPQSPPPKKEITDLHLRKAKPVGFFLSFFFPPLLHHRKRTKDDECVEGSHLVLLAFVAWKARGRNGIEKQSAR